MTVFAPALCKLDQIEMKYRHKIDCNMLCLNVIYVYLKSFGSSLVWPVIKWQACIHERNLWPSVELNHFCDIFEFHLIFLFC